MSRIASIRYQMSVGLLYPVSQQTCPPSQFGHHRLNFFSHLRLRARVESLLILDIKSYGESQHLEFETI